MQLRTATANDVPQIIQLFEGTITTVNSKDYTTEQTTVWSSRGTDAAKWIAKISEQYFIILEEQTAIIGFASLTISGYLDFMYVHKDHQRRGIASMLLKNLEDKAHQLNIHEIISDVSITAKPFFMSKGFKVLAQQSVNLDAVTLTNFKMRKEI
jgi:putative acetyltransferase